MARTIQSPGVEINEIDLSLRPDLPVGTNILIPGFSPAGPVDEVLQVASLSEFEQIYGLPTNAAERYFYHTVRGSFQSPGNIYVSRLPYGANRGDTIADKHYSVTTYNIRAKLSLVDDQGEQVEGTAVEYVDAYNDMQRALDTTYTPASGESSYNHVELEVLDPEYLELSQVEYQDLVNSDISWNDTYTTPDANQSLTPLQKIQHAGLVVLNHKSLTVNEKFEGYYVGIADSAEFFPSSDYTSVQSIKTINKNGHYRTIPDQRLAFGLDCKKENATADEIGPGDKRYQEGTISELFENLPSNDISTAEFSDIMVLGVFKLRKSTLDPDTEKLDYVLSEYHIGSLNANREQFDPNGGQPVSYALQDVAAGSPNIELMVNKHIAESGNWVDRTGDQVKSRVTMTVKEQAKALFAHGVYKEASTLSNRVGEVPTKLERVFELIDNYELFPLDLTLEAGLGTIFAATQGGTSDTNYDDEEFLQLPDLLFKTGQQQFLDGSVDGHQDSEKIVTWYRNVANRFVEFAEKKRKDHMCILDPLRHIFVQGTNSTALSDKSKNFSQHVYWPLRHVYQSINTSYGAVYGNWAKVFDGQLGRNIWVPMSGYMGAMYANTDSNFQPWFAPAGFTRGVLSGIADIAIYPKQKHRDQLYKINVNPVANFPNDGFVVFGQKTLQAKPSAFDRVNVRRLFLYLEKATRSTAKYFVFEPNTLFTRTQVSNILAPIFDRAKNTQGLYDYLLICDERNNTPDVIDQNEMVIDIYIKPVRAAEFILVNFYATRTGQDFSELVS